MGLNKFIKEKRVAAGLTQPELAEKAGVGLRFMRDLEQGKQTLRMDKVNQVLQLFGFQLGQIELKRDVELKPETGSMITTGYAPTVKVKRKSHEKGRN